MYIFRAECSIKGTLYARFEYKLKDYFLLSKVRARKKTINRGKKVFFFLKTASKRIKTIPKHL